MWAQGWFTAQERFVCVNVFYFYFIAFPPCHIHAIKSTKHIRLMYDRSLITSEEYLYTFNLLSLHYFRQSCALWTLIIETRWIWNDRNERWIFPAARLCKKAFSIVATGRQMGWPWHHPLSVSGHVGRFDVVPTPRRRRKRSKNSTTGERTRTRERGRVTRLRQVHDGGEGKGEVRETRTWRDAKWSETRLSFSPGRAVSWTDGRGAGVETVRHRESWRGKRLMDEYSKFWRDRRPISMNYEWIRPFPLSSSDSFRRLLCQRLLTFSRKLWLSSKVICSNPRRRPTIRKRNEWHHQSTITINKSVQKKWNSADEYLWIF